ncbi:hypothetical protein GGQ64_005459 [Rhizobium azooxidifex]|uniref:Uncharacterized protein n=1 Tax=Mycoplana azooxidifex TaxID=1636188 RepID=A0A7W6GLI8_9HYPH|nr:hypothetical protein [Mycoplana azooxidifex]
MGSIIIAGQEVPVVRLDELPIIDPASGNSIPIIADGAAAQSALAVILGLITKAHLAGKLLAEDIPFDPDAADILTMLTAQGAIDELAIMVIKRLRFDAAQSLTIGQKNQAKDNLTVGYAQRSSPILFTVGGTYTPTAGCRAVIIEVQAAGGSGAGSSNSGGAASCGAGGGGGGYATKFITNPVTATVPVFDPRRPDGRNLQRTGRQDRRLARPHIGAGAST